MRSVRDSALIAFAKARIWESEGWDVVIADADGRSHGYAQFDAHVAAFRSDVAHPSTDGMSDDARELDTEDEPPGGVAEPLPEPALS
jgi:hypothetical protein